MSLYTDLRGYIQTKTPAGVAILRKHLGEWADVEFEEDSVEFQNNQVLFSGLYRNLGRQLEACVQELCGTGELEHLNVIEWCEEGDQWQGSWHLRDGTPYVTTYGRGDTAPCTVPVADLLRQSDEIINK